MSDSERDTTEIVVKRSDTGERRFFLPDGTPIVKSSIALIRALQDGLPATMALKVPEVTGLPRRIVDQVVIDRRTLNRRLDKGEALHAEEADRLIRLLRIVERGDLAFGSPACSVEWLTEENGALGCLAPVMLCRTETEAEVVEDMLTALIQGSAA
ncbi:antitoxin Xre/MbcA/ParS toxin-binding domain-containing protein [Aquisalimonas asiatica]|uniref:Putative toxin-antitoxin system antitoxin component, TIGR02293 family n=1 Tax=Aquisalimonas asiatica TaxID=406100 RepID=A0A1H8UWM2_9GAMM|nr:antitoxin Xre/MbcA/ParS toxin-binding domain-containing protein [Aquisalimonas asiatica]SEP07565.1 putative toxin-antitoxin system antitoxin component, TIGR02293 family [Aquisalimonas asiatica]